MVVGINQTRQDDMPGHVHHLICRVWQAFTGTNPLNDSVTDKKTTIGYFPAVVIHSYKDGSMANEKG
jgi:hypothetical protein